ncbi:protein-glutamine gamma-glutamyltransferase 5-like [Salmo salar]|uniref:Protein-glutamine gamma-glutamyltransferase 5-like n=1 Tax=Salmo salar TaxID=8030 RepID=A0ABM3DSC6_SALSA|nr:protein-glutamine gamma-glutamyltransferase 5-like [Salmo salar]
MRDSFNGFDVGKVELHCEKNNTAHKTNDISVNRLIVRRGQSFLVTFELHGPSRPTTDFLELKVETGPQLSEGLGTRSVFGLPEGRWKGSNLEGHGSPGLSAPGGLNHPGHHQPSRCPSGRVQPVCKDQRHRLSGLQPGQAPSAV